VDHERLLAFVRDTCERLELVYMVVGSTASIAYGEPRFTNDIDVVVGLQESGVEAFCSSFSLDDFYINAATVADAVRRKSQFNVIHPGSGLKIDFIVLSESEFDRERTSRRRLLPLLADGPVWLAAPEDVVLKKMVYFRDGGSEKHLRDIAGVVSTTADDFDHQYVSTWAHRLGVAEVWQNVTQPRNT